MPTIYVILSLGGFVIGGAGGYFLRKMQAKRRKDTAEAQAEELIREAKSKEKEIILEAKDESIKLKERAKREENERRKKLEETENRLAKKEESLDQKVDKIEKIQQKLEEKAKTLQEVKQELEELRVKQAAKLEEIAGISKQDARDLLLKKVEEEYREDIVERINKVELEYKAQADAKAKHFIAEAMQRYVGETVSESTVTIVNLPNDEMKGRVIGREGRNINAFERITGVDVIVDDSPGTVVISGFDLVRRYIAKLALEKLISDGRIHPTRIEETVEKCKEEVNKIIKEFGEKVVYDTGVTGVHPDLIKLLGRLRFRTSYGQNVLKHSMEVSFLAGALAEELGADANIARKAALLHDIGKAVSHEIQGSHALIGRDIAKKYGLSEKVIHAIEAHHGEVEPQTLEAVVVQIANEMANARPGAKKDALESHIKRLEDLEKAAMDFAGVKKVFAVQAGRELRVIVDPEALDDLQALKLSRDIANKIEKDLEYPGQIKVTVMRETRVLEYAR
ncbi:MAG: ribonuclease Y [Candidatus Gracilibacteria bacterium]|nr:ribonuclease Y [Candidatus Gracilibacteria bacterium]